MQVINALNTVEEVTMQLKPAKTTWETYLNSLGIEAFCNHKTVVFHHDDMDGAVAAASYQAIHYGTFSSHATIQTPVMLPPGIETSYIRINYDRQADLSVCDLVPEGASVFVLDFAFNREVTDALRKKAGFFLTLDHHKTNLKLLGQTDHSYFDMNDSGAKMAFEYFVPKWDGIPLAVTLADNRDLWKKTDGREDMFHEAAMELRSRCNSNKEFICALSKIIIDERATLELIEKGRMMIHKRDSNIKSATASKRLIKVNMSGYPCALFNYSVDQSDACQHVYDQPEYQDHISGAFAFLANGTVNFSLRKGKKCKADLSQIAELNYGGGGHSASAGFNVSYERALQIISGKEKWAVCWKAEEVDEILKNHSDPRAALSELLKLDTVTLSRTICETDTNWLQVLPYITVSRELDGRYLTYQRASKGEGEKRLEGMWSMGLGGHMDSESVPGDMLNSIIQEASRELHEELGLDPLKYQGKITDGLTIGTLKLIRITDSPVESVHLGLVFNICVDHEDIVFNAEEIEDSLWKAADRMKYIANYTDHEKWTKVIAQAITDGQY